MSTEMPELKDFLPSHDFSEYHIERYTDHSRKVLLLAVDEANRLGHRYIGSEHLLLALMRDNGIGSGVLESLGVDFKKVRVAVEFVVGSEPK